MAGMSKEELMQVSCASRWLQYIIVHVYDIVLLKLLFRLTML